MAKLIIFSALVLVSCGRPWNSNFSDELRFGGDVTGSDSFLEARQVMSNRCFGCHGEWAALDEAAFEAQGYVTGGDLPNSLLYTRIRGNTVQGGGNMPPSETLSASEVDSIRSWIMSF
jgi:mono/diheme cytochrome c family protein